MPRRNWRDVIGETYLARCIWRSAKTKAHLARLAAFIFDPTSNTQMQLVCPAWNFLGGLLGRALKLGGGVGLSCRRCPLKRKLSLRKKSKKQGRCLLKCQLGMGCGHILLYPHKEGGFREQGRSSMYHIRAYLTAITKNAKNSRAFNLNQASCPLSPHAQWMLVYGSRCY